MSFMDALSVLPVVNIKKRRKINKECENASINKLSNSQEVTKVDLSGETNCNASVTALLPTFGSTNHDANNNNNNSLGGSSNTLMAQVKNDFYQEQINVNLIEVPDSPPRFSFYKDILEDTKGEEETKADNNNPVSNQSNNDSNVSKVLDNVDEDRLATENDSETSAAANLCPVKATSDEINENASLSELKLDNSADSFKLKSILNYVKKGSKKSVRYLLEHASLCLVLFYLTNKRLFVLQISDGLMTIPN